MLARAAMLTSPRRIDLVTCTMTDVGPGQVEVAIQGSGVCGSNLPVWQGRPWFEYPLPAGAPGHESWGTVSSVGDGVVTLQPGDPVALIYERAFSERAVVAADDAILLPAPLAAVAFPGEALGCAFNAAARCDFRPGQTVAVVGVGFLGAVMTALAVQAGARVIAVSRRPFSLEVARAMGALETVVMDDHQRVIEEVRDLTDGRLCERVVEAVGTQWPLDLATELTGIGGRLIIAGYHQDGPRSVNLQLWNWRGIDVVNAHERDPEVVRAGVRAAADAVAAGRLDPSPLYTHRFSLGQLDRAMDTMVDRPDGFVKSLVVM